MLRSSKTILAALVLPALVTSAAAHPFTSVVSFGDSLSDTGHNPAVGDYWQGRFSNGPLWDEYLATNLNATLYDYAYSGSETSDLSNQVAAALATSWDSTNTLFTVWSGANDLIDEAEGNGISVSALETAARAAVQNIVQAVTTLGAAGARYIFVPDMPDLSELPIVKSNPVFEKDSSLIRELVEQFNGDLNSALAALAKKQPALRIEVVDDFSLIDAIVAKPSAYGFTVVNADALDAFTDPSFDGPAADYLFWDVIHPTTKAHGLLGQIAATEAGEFTPSFLTMPISQTVAVGAPANFSASSLDATGFQWYLNGHKIAGAASDTFYIAASTTANAGLYDVQAINASGAVASSSARLTVDAAPKITTQPRSQTVVAGHSATFSAKAAGTAPLFYQWQFNGAGLPGATKSILVLTNAQTNQAGSYTLAVSNAVAYANSQPAVLSVIVPPKIISQPAGSNVVVGATVTFSVQAEGTAPLHYQWQRQGASLAGQTNSSCAISVTKTSQAGNYRVLVRNAAGSVISSNAVLKVQAE